MNVPSGTAARISNILSFVHVDIEDLQFCCLHTGFPNHTLLFLLGLQTLCHHNSSLKVTFP